MKRILSIFFVFACITLLSAFTYNTYRSIVIPIATIESEPIQTIKITAPAVKVRVYVKNHEAFLEALGHQESGNRYDIVNRFGYMGKYQFGRETLKTLRIKASRT